MKNLLLLAALAVLPACNGQPFSSEEEGSSLADDLTDNTPPQWLLLSRCERANCKASARSLENLSLRCADQVDRAICDVSTIVWPGPSEGVLPLISLSYRQERLAVRARWTQSGALEVLDVSTRVGEGDLSTNLEHASSRECANEGCVPLQISPLSGARGWVESWLDFSHSPGDDRSKNLAMVQAWTSEGVFLSGARKGSGQRRRFVVSDYFLHYSFAPSLCGDTIVESIQKVSSGLLWPSETDAPIRPWLAALKEGEREEEVLQDVLGLDTVVDTETIVGIGALTLLGQDTAGMSAQERIEAARFRALRALLESNLSELRTFRIGQEDARLWVLGRTRCGELAGIETSVTET